MSEYKDFHPEIGDLVMSAINSITPYDGSYIDYSTDTAMIPLALPVLKGKSVINMRGVRGEGSNQYSQKYDITLQFIGNATHQTAVIATRAYGIGNEVRAYFNFDIVEYT